MAVYKNLVIPRRNEDGHVDMSLRAAEKARKASEIFIQKVNELIPEDPQKYHKDLLKGIDGKLALLKKNVAYLVLQNLTLIDKLMDAENTIHQVRNLHDLRNNWKDRPNTFAAPDTPTDKDFNTNSDRTKCESWCNPIIDFVIFNDNATDLQSRKLSLTNKFVTNRLRQYIIREDMINYLEPHLATYLFPNYKDKDSDNDSGTGEEIASPDEFENSNHKFDQTDCASIVDTPGKLDDLDSTSIIANGNFSVSCSRGILAKKSGNKIIGIVQSVELGSSQMDNNLKQGMSIPEKINNENESSSSTMTEISVNRHNSSSLGKESKRRGCAAIGNLFSEKKANDGDLNGNQEKSALKTLPTIKSKINAVEDKDLDKEKSQVERTSTKNKSNFEKHIDVKLKSRYSSIRGNFEKDSVTASTTSLNDEGKQTATHKTSHGSLQGESENKGMRSKIKDQVTTMFHVKEKFKNRFTESESNILQKQKQFDDNSLIIKQSKDDSSMKKQGKEKQVLTKSASLNFDKESTLSANSNGNRYFPGSVRQKSLGKSHRKESINENGNEDDDVIKLDKKANKRQQQERDSISENSTDHSDRRKNFSSKVNRGNKLRKSKRIEETHKIFELNNKEKDGKQQNPDPTLRFAASIHKSPFSENKQETDKQRNKFSANKYVTTLKQSDKVLSRRENSQGDLSGT